jgi:hypothetical protein
MTATSPHRIRRHINGPFAGQLEHFLPDADERGMYELGDPVRGTEKHHKKNAIFVETIDMALHLVRTYGFSIRMRGNLTKQRNLISADQIECL